MLLDMDDAAQVLDLLSSALVVVAVLVGWRSLRTSEARVKKKYADFYALRAEVQAGYLTEEAAENDSRNLPELILVGVHIQTADTLARKIELSIIRAAMPSLTLPFILGTSAAVLGLLAAGLSTATPPG